ncbi:cyclase family protein [Lujinxingia litoralis]|nr:cyclase family protein [Lujinxingia litoralis]
MRMVVEFNGQHYEVDHRPVELAQPLDFYGAQPQAFGLGRASARAVEGGSFVGDVRRGGSVNCEAVELIAHGHGTHTECAGHITGERMAVGSLAPEALIPATLLRVKTCALEECPEHTAGISAPGDRVISAAALQAALVRAAAPGEFVRAILIATAGPGAAIPLRDYSGTNPAYFTAEAIAWLLARGCEHLLVDLPSIDREDDGGTTPAHHAYFGVDPQGGLDQAGRRRTITEMIAVPDDLEEGAYFLSLRFARFLLDAAPSRPVLYRALACERSY